jgi:hypothetical protein
MKEQGMRHTSLLQLELEGVDYEAISQKLTESHIGFT